MSSGKALGADAIPAEVFIKARGLSMAEKLTELFHWNMWRKEAIPQEFMDVSIIKEIHKSVTITETSLSLQ